LIGLTLLATYLVMGHGLGASRAFTQATASLIGTVAPEHLQKNEYLSPYAEGGAFRLARALEGRRS
jgi:hypothetical protein